MSNFSQPNQIENLVEPKQQIFVVACIAPFPECTVIEDKYIPVLAFFLFKIEFYELCSVVELWAVCSSFINEIVNKNLQGPCNS
jgi:hypothetical protein